MTLLPLPAAPAQRRLAFWPTVALALALAGCSEPEKITTYETPRVEPRAVAVDPNEVRAILDHMFAAVVPAGDKAWFFKLVVPGAEAEEFRKPFDDFLATVDAKASDAKAVEVKGDAAKAEDAEVTLPGWTLPTGWTQREGDEMRAATIVIPHKGAEVELTVTTLPYTGKWADYLTQNVNRWLGQLQQPALDLPIIEKLGRKVSTKGEAATAFELVGTMKRNPMGMGMGGMPAGHPPIGGAPAPQSASATPSGPAPSGEAPRPSVNVPPVAAAPSGELAYEAPADWGPGPPSGMRKASFAISGAAGKADVSITTFGASGQMADPTANAQRWAAQVGLANLSDEEMSKASAEVKIGGATGRRFEFLSPADAPSAQGILAAMAVRGDVVWFVKLSGDRAVVEAQREAFDKFLASIKFPAAK